MGHHHLLWWGGPRKCLGKGWAQGLVHLLHHSSIPRPPCPKRCMVHHQCGKVHFCLHTRWWSGPNDGPCAPIHLLLHHGWPKTRLQAQRPTWWHQWWHHHVLWFPHGSCRWRSPKVGLVIERGCRYQILYAMCQCPCSQKNMQWCWTQKKRIVMPKGIANSNWWQTSSYWQATRGSMWGMALATKRSLLFGNKPLACAIPNLLSCWTRTYYQEI